MPIQPSEIQALHGDLALGTQYTKSVHVSHIHSRGASELEPRSEETVRCFRFSGLAQNTWVVVKIRVPCGLP